MTTDATDPPEQIDASDVPAVSDSPADAPPDDVRDRHSRLSRELDEHLYRYHVLDSPTVSDGEYDALMRELQRIEDGPSVPADAELTDPAGRGDVLDPLHPGRAPRAAAEPRQRVLR